MLFFPPQILPSSLIVRICMESIAVVSVSALNVTYYNCSFACKEQPYREYCMMFFGKSKETCI